MSLKLTFAPLSDVGRERTENQDAFGSEHFDGLDFYVVCDGMGGHRGGSTASRLAIDEVTAYLRADTDGTIAERMVAAFTRANDVIYDKAQSEPELHGMGTTAVILAIDHSDRSAHYAHVGDSRLYLLRADRLQQLTRDHTFVQRLVDDGILSHEAAEHHPQANVIIRSLGGQPHVDVEVGDTPISVQDGDVFLICSDGLHGLVPEPEIATIVASNELDEAARTLVERANEEGGHDNITVELIRVGERAEAIPEVWTVVRPTPAPGTRLARKASEREVDDTPVDPAGETGEVDLGEAPTEIREFVAPEKPSRNLGAFVIVAVVVAIIAAALALAMVVRGSSPERSGEGSHFPHVVPPE